METYGHANSMASQLNPSRSTPAPAPRNPLQRRTTFMARWDVMQVDAASIAAQAARQDASTIPVPLTRRQTVSKALGLDKVFSTSKRLQGGTATTFSSGILDTMESDTHSQRSHYSAPSSNFQRALAALFTTQQGFILPSSKNLHWWSLLVSGFMVYLLLVAPYRLAVHHIDHAPELGAVLTDTIAALVFALDIVIRLNTGVVNPRTREEDIRKLRTKYARSRLIRDVLGCIPVELLGLSLRHAGDAGQALMMALAIMRLSRGTHVVNLERTLAGEHFNLNRGIRRLIATVVFVPLMSHLFACLWIFIGSRPRNPDMNDTWLEVFLATEAGEQQNVDVFIAALEWSVSTLSSVGFGDFSGVNDEEHIVSILVCACGALLAGVLVAQTSSIVSDMNEAQHQINLRMHSLRAYLRYRRVPKSLQMRMIRYFRHLYTRRAHFDEVSILENMTADLRRALSLYLLEDTLQDLNIFRGISDTQLVASLIAMLKPVSFSAGTEIVRHGEPITEMYFIVRGKVEVLAPGDEAVVSDVQDEKDSAKEVDKDRTAADGSRKLRNKLRVIATLGEGNHFGELSSTTGQGIETHLVTVRAVESTDLFSLTQQHLSELAKTFPLVNQRLQSFKQAKQNALARIKNNNLLETTKASSGESAGSTSSFRRARGLLLGKREGSGNSGRGNWQRLLSFKGSTMVKLSASFKEPVQDEPTEGSGIDDTGSVIRLRRPIFQGRNSKVYTKTEAEQVALLSVNMNLAKKGSGSNSAASPHLGGEHDSTSEMDDFRTTANDLIPNDSSAGDEKANVQRELRGAEPTEDGDDVFHKGFDVADIECKSPAPAGQVLMLNEQGTEANAQRDAKIDDAFMSSEKASVDIAADSKTSPLVDPLACGSPDLGANVQDLVRDLLETARLQDHAIAALRARLANRKRSPGSERGFSAMDVSAAQAVH